MNYEIAIKRLEAKSRYTETRLADPALPDKTRHYATLDIATFQLAIDALRYLRDLAEYEQSAQNLK